MKRINQILVFLLLGSALIVNAQKKMDNKTTKLQPTSKWDKVFPQSNKVEHCKVTFHNHFGIELAADLYTPKGATGMLSAIAVSGPFGAVKEQSSGLYAQTLAEQGYLTLAFDPSFTGESGGNPRDMFSLDINTEDFQAAVDYLSNQPNVDPNRIGILGVCGWGGIALNAAANDPRIKATVASTMYDMPRVGAWGYNDSGTADDRYNTKAQIAQLRTKEYATGPQQRAASNVPLDQMAADAPAFLRQYSAYYTTKRGYNERSVNSKNGWKLQAMTGWMNNNLLSHPEDLRNAVLIVHGEKAHSRYMGEDTFKKLTGDNKQLLIVPNATHTDLYDQMDKIPFDRIVQFYQTYLK